MLNNNASRICFRRAYTHKFSPSLFCVPFAQLAKLGTIQSYYQRAVVLGEREKNAIYQNYHNGCKKEKRREANFTDYTVSAIKLFNEVD